MREFICVSALNEYVKALLDSNDILNNIWILGEVANFRSNYASGHWYFTLRDEKSSVRAVMWSGAAQKVKFKISDGIQVLARCDASLYERDGAFQVYVSELEPRGAGALDKQLNELKQKLAAEGLFDDAHKKPLPRFALHIVALTSASGAARRDIENVLARRWPCAKLTILPVTVQGSGGERALTDAVRRADALGCDTIIIARGGGSAEDLSLFNSELLARAVYECRTPVISAVGHETDFTLLDFVADRRAPTPSAAAELACPDKQEIEQYLRQLYGSIMTHTAQTLDSAQRAVSSQWATVKQQLKAGCELRRERLAAAARLCESLSPLAVLERGYAYAAKDGTAVTQVKQLSPGDELLLSFRDGTAKCRVEEITPNE